VAVGASNGLPDLRHRARSLFRSDPNSHSGFDPATDKLPNIAAFSQPADFTFGNTAVLKSSLAY
jgi:hypothetical protein